MTGKQYYEESKLKMSKSAKKAKFFRDENYRKKLSKGLKRYWATVDIEKIKLRSKKINETRKNNLLCIN